MPDPGAVGGMDAGGSSLAMTSLGGCMLMLSVGSVTNGAPKCLLSWGSEWSALPSWGNWLKEMTDVLIKADLVSCQ